MGFEAKESEKALKRAGNDLIKALDFLKDNTFEGMNEEQIN